MSTKPPQSITVIHCGNGLILMVLSIIFLLIPSVTVLNDLRDPALRRPGVPSCALRLHRQLSPRYERWAQARLASGRAAQLDVQNISGTEWPLFGTVFYLWATEALQQEWERDPSLSARAPADYARRAVEAAAALIVDPKHATWVEEHWGEDYLHNENVFFRMLLVGGLTSHYRITGNDEYLPLLRDQVETLSRALDESPYGLLDDYPGQCYPADVLAAIACIRRADAILDADHSAFASRALRGFAGSLLDATGLPPYSADARTGHITSRARGCANSFMLTWACDVWPDVAAGWYQAYDTHFWQRRWGLAGFREFPRDVAQRDWYMDVDSGPVIAGFGFAASAFGVGAARSSGRFDHAYPLTSEMLAVSWPLIDGTFLLPRLLSDTVDAPYLGEASILFCLTRQPVGGSNIRAGSRLPGFVYVVLGFGFVGGGLVALLGLRRFLLGGRRLHAAVVPMPRVQLAIWAALGAAALILVLVGNMRVGLLALLIAQLLPRGPRKRRTETDTPCAV